MDTQVIKKNILLPFVYYWSDSTANAINDALLRCPQDNAVRFIFLPFGKMAALPSQLFTGRGKSHCKATNGGLLLDHFAQQFGTAFIGDLLHKI